MNRHAGIVVFDLDHTLARSDSFLQYLSGFLLRRPWRVIRCLHLPVIVLLFFAGLLTNAKLKEFFLRAILGGIRQQELAIWNRTFLDRFLRAQLRSEGLATLAMHRQAGERLILLTASPDCYVNELGRRLGFDEVIGTKVEWKDGRLTGSLAGPNMRGVEKVRALENIRSRYGSGPVTAYADHRSDLAMLRQADRGILVNAGPGIRALTQQDPIECVVWRD